MNIYIIVLIHKSVYDAKCIESAVINMHLMLILYTSGRSQVPFSYSLMLYGSRVASIVRRPRTISYHQIWLYRHICRVDRNEGMFAFTSGVLYEPLEVYYYGIWNTMVNRFVRLSNKDFTYSSLLEFILTVQFFFINYVSIS